jgi:hypothetical protein
MVFLSLTHIFVVSAYLRWAVEAETCNSRQNRTTTAPKVNIWRGLSDAETTGLDDYIRKYFALNSTGSNRSRNYTGYSNKTELSLLSYEFILPTKADALLYLDENGSAPDRYGQFSISYEDRLQLYSVGPLPISKLTNVLAMESIPGQPVSDQMNYTQGDSEHIFNENLAADMQDILSDLIGVVRAHGVYACFGFEC